MKTYWSAAAVLLPGAWAQFISAPTDLTSKAGAAGYSVRYKEVPSGICETVEGVKSYSGYVDIAEDKHLFFWFFEARNQDPATAPLTIWINGGPGDPSMVGLFSENGPCSIDYDGNLQFNEYSWNNASNMLYLDQPVDTGFSYSIPVNGYTSADGYIVTLPDATCPDYAPADSCGTLSSANVSLTANSTPSAAPDFYAALQGFTGAFPEYSSNGIHIATESYGGHYGPYFAAYIQDQNALNTPGTAHLDLRGLAVGNGWFDPIIQFQAHYNFTVSPGNNWNFKPYNASQEAQLYNALYGEGNCLDQLLDCNARGEDGICSTADNLCYQEVEYLYDTVTGRDEYDLRYLSPNPFPPTSWVSYLNRPEIQQAIGAFTNFSYSVTNLGTGTVATAFGTTGDDARGFDVAARNRELVEEGVYVLHYYGDADYMCSWIGGEAVAASVDAAGWSGAGYENITTSDGEVHGVVKQSGKFGFARVYDAGHSVPFYKPRAALTLLERLLNQTDIATGTESVDGYVSVGPVESTYLNDNSTIQTEVVDASCTYNTETDLPECGSAGSR
ncbi:hypothetical protein PRZ48_001323 [Zasmidium cellare]|uniref:Carboxypeptidase n=1 Tax=Zasmidium cellare TaxID=395010 RepID=A0ABR0F2A6_ZASCE|nr:hypothetical protein PRZ48_001323 [Zasmidium cellare]